MERLRSVNTNFWKDPWVESLKPEEKLLFLYLITNPHTNMLGVYEVSIKRMAADTGLTEERVSKCFEVFETHRKGLFEDNYVILPNFLKNQKMNPNMQKSAVKTFNYLPNWLKDKISDTPLEGFERLSKALEGFGMVRKIEREIEREIEMESEKENIIKETGNCLMKNSGVTPEDISSAFLNTKDLQQADPEHYFNQVLDWSSANNKMKKDWVAAVRNWARGDLGKGQLKVLPYKPQRLGEGKNRL